MDARPPGVDDRVRLAGVFRLYTVRAAHDGMLTVVGSRQGDVKVVRADEVELVERAPDRSEEP